MVSVDGSLIVSNVPFAVTVAQFWPFGAISFWSLTGTDEFMDPEVLRKEKKKLY